MDKVLKAAFAFQKRQPNVRLQSIISRVEERYFSDDAELDEDQLAQVWAAGKAERSLPKKKGNKRSG